MGTILQLVCPACLTKNRVPASRLRDRPVCGRCKARVFAETPVSLDEAKFDRFTRENEIAVLVDFWAPWCGPCRAMAPQFEAAGRELAGEVLFAKLDTEAHPSIAARFAIQGIPTLVLFEGGQEIARRSGMIGAVEIAGWVASARGTRPGGVRSGSPG